MSATAFTTSQATTRLRTAAAIENAAVAICQAAVSSAPLVSGPGSTVVKDAATRLMAHHRAQAKTLNDAAVSLGGNPQTDPDGPVLRDATAALDRCKTTEDVLSALANVENLAASSLATYAGQVADSSATKALMAVAPIHAANAATLITLSQIAAVSAAALDLRLDFGSMPAMVGAAGFPDGVLSSQSARPATEAS